MTRGYAKRVSCRFATSLYFTRPPQEPTLLSYLLHHHTLIAQSIATYLSIMSTEEQQDASQVEDASQYGGPGAPTPLGQLEVREIQQLG